MKQKVKTKTSNPAEIAREVFRRLASRRIPPTPDAYRDIYDEIMGTAANLNAETVLTKFAASIAEKPGEVSRFGVRFNRSLAERDWEDYSKNLNLLIDKFVSQAKPNATSASNVLQANTIINKRFDNESRSSNENAQTKILRDLLNRTLSLALASLLQSEPELAEESESIALLLDDASSEEALASVAVRLKKLCFKIETKSGDIAEKQELLLRLFNLLLDNVSGFIDEDAWLSGQITGIQDVLSGPLSHSALINATRSMKDVIYKQGKLKHSLTQAKVTVKKMMITFIDRLSAVAATTGDYHEKIDQYSHKISLAQTIGELNKILEDVMRETRITQTEALRSRDEIINVQLDAQQAQEHIKTLESKLEQMSELVREDQLTGSLNRRGLDEVFEREIARSDRRKTPLCIAMLDLDNFKQLNDGLGHIAGDGALIHLVNIIKDTLRTVDVVARFGGEEFLIVLPDTSIEYASQTVSRLQKALVNKPFTYNGTTVLMTFSAGVALRQSGEDQAQLIKRADDALYDAKHSGKNCVVVAPSLSAYSSRP